MKMKSQSGFGTPKLGATAMEFAAPWKPSGMGWTQYGFVLCTCHNTDRKYSRIYLDDKKIYDDYEKKQTENETIGNPLVVGQEVFLAGENGSMFHWNGRALTKPFTLRFATACALWGGVPVVPDTNGGVCTVRRAVDGVPTGIVLPGDGIVMAAVEHEGALYGAMADGTKSGLTCSNGRFVDAPACMCVVSFHGLLIYTIGNKIMERDLGLLQELPCEKIMDAKVADNKIWFACDNPASLYAANMRGEVVHVGTCDGSTEVGGSCFRVRVAINPQATNGYFAYTVGGNRGVVKKIVWG